MASCPSNLTREELRQDGRALDAACVDPACGILVYQHKSAARPSLSEVRESLWNRLAKPETKTDHDDAAQNYFRRLSFVNRTSELRSTVHTLLTAKLEPVSGQKENKLVVYCQKFGSGKSELARHVLSAVRTAEDVRRLELPPLPDGAPLEALQRSWLLHLELKTMQFPPSVTTRAGGLAFSLWERLFPDNLELFDPVLDRLPRLCHQLAQKFGPFLFVLDEEKTIELWPLPTRVDVERGWETSEATLLAHLEVATEVSYLHPLPDVFVIVASASFEFSLLGLGLLPRHRSPQGLAWVPIGSLSAHRIKESLRKTIVSGKSLSDILQLQTSEDASSHSSPLSVTSRPNSGAQVARSMRSGSPPLLVEEFSALTVSERHNPLPLSAPRSPIFSRSVPRPPAAAAGAPSAPTSLSEDEFTAETYSLTLGQARMVTYVVDAAVKLVAGGSPITRSDFNPAGPLWRAAQGAPGALAEGAPHPLFCILFTASVLGEEFPSNARVQIPSPQGPAITSRPVFLLDLVARCGFYMTPVADGKFRLAFPPPLRELHLVNLPPLLLVPPVPVDGREAYFERVVRNVLAQRMLLLSLRSFRMPTLGDVFPCLAASPHGSAPAYLAAPFFSQLPKVLSKSNAGTLVAPPSKRRTISNADVDNEEEAPQAAAAGGPVSVALNSSSPAVGMWRKSGRQNIPVNELGPLSQLVAQNTIGYFADKSHSADLVYPTNRVVLNLQMKFLNALQHLTAADLQDEINKTAAFFCHTRDPSAHASASSCASVSPLPDEHCVLLIVSAFPATAAPASHSRALTGGRYYLFSDQFSVCVSDNTTAVPKEYVPPAKVACYFTVPPFMTLHILGQADLTNYFGADVLESLQCATDRSWRSPHGNSYLAFVAG